MEKTEHQNSNLNLNLDSQNYKKQTWKKPEMVILYKKKTKDGTDYATWEDFDYTDQAISG